MGKILDFFKNFGKKKKAEVIEDKQIIKPKKVALCLGGGGARGYGHIGAIKALEEAGIDFDFCIGTSVGSLVGSLYCAGVGADEMIDYASTIDIKQVHNGIIIMPNDAGKIGRLASNLIGDALLENLPKKMYVVSVDLISGKQYIFEKGLVSTAVSASACVPVFFKPVVYDGMHLVDGGLLNNIPADTAKMLGADRVVTIDINPTRGGGTSSTSITDIIKATFSIMGSNASQIGLQNSDIVIAPDMSKFRATKKTGYKEMIAQGYESAKQQIPMILKMLNGEDFSAPLQNVSQANQNGEVDDINESNQAENINKVEQNN